MNTDTQSPHLIDPKGRRLRTSAEHLFLERMIDRLHDDQIEPDVLCKMLHTFCELKKSDIAAQKQAAEETPKCQQSNTAGSASHSCSPIDKPDSHGELRRRLRQSISDLYGITDVDSDDAPSQIAKSHPHSQLHPQHDHHSPSSNHSLSRQDPNTRLPLRARQTKPQYALAPSRMANKPPTRAYPFAHSKQTPNTRLPLRA